MNKSTFFLMMTFLAAGFGCNEDANTGDPTAIGVWQLTEVLIDPGNGSGTFQPTTVDKTLTFFDDNTVTTSDTFCHPGEAQGGVSTAVYSADDGTISPDCESIPGLTLYYELEEDELIVRYLCIEACAEKYQKTQIVD